jgi:hypothetical protein
MRGDFMLRYWILKRSDGTPVGLVRAENDRVLLTLNAPLPAAFTLFSESASVPVTPGSETRLLQPLALLGMDGDEPVCFAAAPDAPPLAQFLNRMSHICTKEKAAPPEFVDLSQNSTIEPEKPAEQPAASEESADDISQNSTIEVEETADSVSDTAHATAEFALLLERANAFYAKFTDQNGTYMVQKEDTESKGGIDLFPQRFPGARWRYVDGADVLPHYEGTWRSETGETFRILAVRGRMAPRPPRTLCGFSQYLRDRDGFGYWVKMTGKTDGR